LRRGRHVGGWGRGKDKGDAGKRRRYKRERLGRDTRSCGRGCTGGKRETSLGCRWLGCRRFSGLLGDNLVILLLVGSLDVVVCKVVVLISAVVIVVVFGAAVATIVILAIGVVLLVQDSESILKENCFFPLFQTKFSKGENEYLYAGNSAGDGGGRLNRPRGAGSNRGDPDKTYFLFIY